MRLIGGHFHEQLAFVFIPLFPVVEKFRRVKETFHNATYYERTKNKSLMDNLNAAKSSLLGHPFARGLASVEQDDGRKLHSLLKLFACFRGKQEITLDDIECSEFNLQKTDNF
jgi:hypothetical protein